MRLPRAAGGGAFPDVAGRLGRAPGLPREALELLVTLALIALLLAMMWKVGVDSTAVLALLAAAIVVAISSPTAFAVVVFVLAPLPALDALTGITLPAGLDPFEILVLIGAGVALQTEAARPVRGRRVLWTLLIVNFALLLLAWYRTYGEQALTADSVALVLRPAATVAAGIIAVRLLPPSKVVRTLALAISIALLLVAASIVLQRLGLFSTPYHEENVLRLGSKQYGGLMLDGNDAGWLFAIFAVPAFLLLRAVNLRSLGFVVLLSAIPVLLITLSRSSIAAFIVSLTALLFLDRARMRGVATALIVVAVAVAWAATVGQSQITALEQSFSRYPGDRNAALSGRETIWTAAQDFLAADKRRWVVGGGLDSFRDFAESTPLRSGFATHNSALKQVTNGGLVMLAAYLLLFIAMWWLSGRAEPTLRMALRVALVGFLVVGLSGDLDFFSPAAAWLWALAAAVAGGRFLGTPDGPAPERSPVAGALGTK